LLVTYDAPGSAPVDDSSRMSMDIVMK